MDQSPDPDRQDDHFNEADLEEYARAFEAMDLLTQQRAQFPLLIELFTSVGNLFSMSEQQQRVLRYRVEAWVRETGAQYDIVGHEARGAELSSDRGIASPEVSRNDSLDSVLEGGDDQELDDEAGEDLGNVSLGLNDASQLSQLDSCMADASGRYVCQVCSKAYANRSNLRRHHLSAHTDERPYDCADCGRRFARNDSLLAHQRNQHGDAAATGGRDGIVFQEEEDLGISETVHISNRATEGMEKPEFREDHDHNDSETQDLEMPDESLNISTQTEASKRDGSTTPKPAPRATNSPFVRRPFKLGLIDGVKKGRLQREDSQRREITEGGTPVRSKPPFEFSISDDPGEGDTDTNTAVEDVIEISSDEEEINDGLEDGMPVTSTVEVAPGYHNIQAHDSTSCASPMHELFQPLDDQPLVNIRNSKTTTTTSSSSSSVRPSDPQLPISGRGRARPGMDHYVFQIVPKYTRPPPEAFDYYGFLKREWLGDGTNPDFTRKGFMKTSQKSRLRQVVEREGPEACGLSEVYWAWLSHRTSGNYQGERPRREWFRAYM